MISKSIVNEVLIISKTRICLAANFEFINIYIVISEYLDLCLIRPPTFNKHALESRIYIQLHDTDYNVDRVMGAVCLPGAGHHREGIEIAGCVTQPDFTKVVLTKRIP